MSKFLNVVVGVAGGFVAGLLLAPKSGEKTREEIKQKMKEAKGTLENKVDETTEAVKGGAGVAGKEARGMMDSAKQSAQVVAGEANSLGSEMVERTGRAVREFKETGAKSKSGK